MSLGPELGGMQGMEGAGGAGQNKDNMDSLAMGDKELLDIVTKMTPGDASQIIELNLGNNSIGALEGLKHKVEGIGKPELKTSIDNVIKALTDHIQTQKDSINNKVGGPPPTPIVDPVKNINQAAQQKVQGTLGGTLV